MHAVAVADPVAGPVTCLAATLAPGASTTCTAPPRVLTQADVDAALVANTATASALGPDGSPLQLVKSASVTDLNASGGSDLGDEITWSFQVTNTGSVTVDTLQIDDPAAGPVTCPVTVLAPSASTTCTADSPHRVTQADLDAGVLTNTATASGQATSGPTVTSAPSTTALRGTPCACPAPPARPAPPASRRRRRPGPRRA